MANCMENLNSIGIKSVINLFNVLIGIFIAIILTVKFT